MPKSVKYETDEGIEEEDEVIKVKSDFEHYDHCAVKGNFVKEGDAGYHCTSCGKWEQVK